MPPGERDTRQFDATYARFADQLYASIRGEAFGEDIGQNSWTTAEEIRRFCEWLALDRSSHLLDIASGAGGPDLYIAKVTGCRITGVDVFESATRLANERAKAEGVADRVRFVCADARTPLPLESGEYDAVLCIDAINHFFERAGLFREFARLLRPGGRALFTNAVTLTGLLRKEEATARSYGMGEFVFTPAGHDERLLRDAGLEVVRVEDVTANPARVARAWVGARARRASELDRIEGAPQNAEMQKFLESVATLAHERRLSRFAYLARKP
jgi:cyclopropane fatty-acyl-phospholipid synthase-like methyltransferase